MSVTVSARRQHARDLATGEGLVTVVIPAYNQGRFLADAIESVRSQSYQRLEIVVVDDGSTDETPDVAARFSNLYYIRQENSGLPNARNRGLAQSHGEYVVFLDADDKLLEGALETGVRHLSDHAECAFAAGHCRFIETDGTPLATPPQPLVERNHYAALLTGNYIWNPAAVVYRRSVLDDVGGFDPRLDAAEDYDLYLRIARRYRIFTHDSLVSEYRQHRANMSRNAGLMLKATMSAIRAQRRHLHHDLLHRYTAGAWWCREFYGGKLLEQVTREFGLASPATIAKDIGDILRNNPQGLALLALGRIAPRAELRMRERSLRRFRDVLTDDMAYHQLVRCVRAAVRAVVPEGARVLVATHGDDDFLELGNRRGWHFPQVDAVPGTLFAAGRNGRQHASWIRAGVTYAFRLYREGDDEPVATAKAEGVRRPRSRRHSDEGGPQASVHSVSSARLIVTPSHVAAGYTPGTTTVQWSTDDGSEGRVYVSEERAYAGCHPASSSEAIAHLEELRTAEAQFLVIPRPVFWWLEYYAGFARHLANRYRVIWKTRDCVIYDLRLREGGPR